MMAKKSRFCKVVEKMNGNGRRSQSSGIDDDNDDEVGTCVGVWLTWGTTGEFGKAGRRQKRVMVVKSWKEK
ncbi:hypothetical protein SUGI_1170550 [Cryptomeria japonica]|nr:hypothetical protein SUGI_1170550 [Cryptomeria japonica]